MAGGHTSLYLVQTRGGKLRQFHVFKAFQDSVRESVGHSQEMQHLLDERSALERKRFLAEGRPFTAG